jgi:hypothetical protein
VFEKSIEAVSHLAHLAASVGVGQSMTNIVDYTRNNVMSAALPQEVLSKKSSTSPADTTSSYNLDARGPSCKLPMYWRLCRKVAYAASVKVFAVMSLIPSVLLRLSSAVPARNLADHESAIHLAYGATNLVKGPSDCDCNLFNGDSSMLHQFWAAAQVLATHH